MSRAKIMITVAVIVVIAVALVGALMVFNKSPDLLNSEFKIIVTDSMDGEPTDYEISTIPVNSLIAVHKMNGADANSVKIGDVIGFRSPIVNYNMVYHRVVSVDESAGTFTTHGDNTTANETVHFNEVTGKVANVSEPVGKAVVYVQNNLLFVIFVLVMLFIMAEAFSYLLKIWKE